MWTLIDSELRNRFRHHEGVKQDLEKVSRCVTAGSMTPAAAAHRLLGHLQESN
jgi:LAO/AO transport system kinase